MVIDKKWFNCFLALAVSFALPFVLLDDTKGLLDMFLPFVGIIVPFQITTYSLVVGIMDADSLMKIKEINANALSRLCELFEEFSSDTRLVILFGILYFIATFIAKTESKRFGEIFQNVAEGIAIFSIFAIFVIVIESIDVILKVGKSKIDVMKCE